MRTMQRIMSLGCAFGTVSADVVLALSRTIPNDFLVKHQEDGGNDGEGKGNEKEDHKRKWSAKRPAKWRKR